MPAESHELARAVAQLHRRLRRERDSDLTPSQLSLLGTLTELGPSTPGAVAAHERIQPPTVTRALSYLVDEGYVLREPHPDDGRQVLVSVSDKGSRILAEERDRRDAWLHQRLLELAPAERETLRRATEILAQVASA